jgi:glutathione S-transferase
MDLTLYYVPATRALRARWMLEEVGAPYALHRVDVKAGENKTAEYRASVHPLGHVPALRIDGRMMFESQAICQWLADAFPAAGLAPAITDPARGEYLQWMAFSVAELEAPLLRVTGQSRKPPEQRSEIVLAEGRSAFQSAADVVGAHLADRPFLLGEKFSGADLMVASVFGWARMAGVLDADGALAEYTRRCTGRDASKRARAD